MELTINNLIKLILGIVVAIAVITGIYLFFKNNVIDLFEGIGGNESANLILFLLK